jgi:hypothetical protein
VGSEAFEGVRGERRPVPLVGDDVQHRPVPPRALRQRRQELRRQRQRVEAAAVRPSQRHLGEEPLLKLGRRRPLPPAHPGDQQRLCRIGQDGGPGNVAERPQGQPRGEQRGAAADHHLATARVGHR